MPTERFYRLPDEKKKVICSAAVKEFARVPIDKVSINKIIKEAEISRGSFYTYFEDKWDLLECIFEESQNRLRNFCRNALIESDGNVWDMLEKFLKEILKFCSEKEQFAFIKSVMSHTGAEEIVKGFTHKMNTSCEQKNEEIERWIYDNMDKKSVAIKEYKEFHCFFQLAMFSTAVEIKNYFNDVPMEVIQERYAIKMEILKHGICQSGSEGRAGGS